MLTLLMAAAYGQTVTGGLGSGVFASPNAIRRVGWTSNASIEVGEVVPDLPWLGFGAEAVLGFQPKFCTECDVQGTARLGAGVALRQGGGFLLAGVRASILGDLRRVRPFVISKARLPVSRVELRPFLWAEGFTLTEVGVGLEIGFAIRDGKFIVREAKPGASKPVKQPSPPEEGESEEPEEVMDLPAMP